MTRPGDAPSSGGGDGARRSRAAATSPSVSADALRRLADRLSVEAHAALERRGVSALTYMEVCGTHTMAIARFGLRDLLPSGMRLISGPGCPVCVTATADLDKAVALARLPEVTLTTFGDLVRVPASRSSLAAARAAGADVRVVYSARDAVEIAAAEPDRQVVFAGIGFETTAPTVAAALLEAQARGLSNFCVLSMHKTMPLALKALLELGETDITGFILPGHVSVVTGSGCYEFLAREYGVGGAIAGFEAYDVLQALLLLVRQTEPAITIEYGRAVRPEGNVVAQRLMAQVFEPCDADWRGLGVIPGSGLRIRDGFAAFDAERRFTVDAGEPLEPTGCRCGEVLRGVLDPAACGLFGRRCTPEDPIGACMVSSEGACAARYRYRGIDD
ncbi:MAG TPA: hydrogenase formation protein HypD [Thermoleophilia bacterium]|nr:hydrogenase formation protein HypD [Thermoleophilia bacterium]